MTLHIYRFQEGYTTGIDAALAKFVSPTAVLQNSSFGKQVGIECDDSRLLDLEEYMATLGFFLIATDPGDNPSTVLSLPSGTLSFGTVGNGQVLTNVGGVIQGANPAGFDIRSQLIFDHFLGSQVISGSIGSAGWAYSGTGAGNAAAIIGEAGHPGISRLSCGTAAAGRAAVHLGDTTLRNVIQGGANPIIYEVMYSPRSTLSSANVLRHQVGLGSGWALASPNPLTDGVYFRFEPLINATNIFGVCANASSRTVVDLGAIGIAQWYRLGFTYTPGGTPAVQFYRGGVAQGAPVTTNLPNATLLGAGHRIDGSGGTGAELAIDYVSLTQVTI